MKTAKRLTNVTYADILGALCAPLVITLSNRVSSNKKTKAVGGKLLLAFIGLQNLRMGGIT